MRTAQSRQKSYADLQRRHVEFSVCELVFLKVSPTRGVLIGDLATPKHRYFLCGL